MSKLLCALAGLSCVLLVSAWAADEEKPTDQKELIGKVSYSIGFDLATNFSQRGVTVDTEMLMKGAQDALAGTKPMISEQDRQAAMTQLQKQMMAESEKLAKELGERNRKEGEAFLAENAKKQGVITTPSGLQYVIEQEGNGPSPKATDTVSVNYRGTLINGTEFDSSFKRGQPASLKVNRVIPGWTEALQLMKTGAKWKLFIPSALAYGERQASAQIGPNATLIFDVELLEIKAPTEEGEAQ